MSAERLREAAAVLRGMSEAVTVCPQPPFAAETPWTADRGHVKDAGGWTVCQGKGPEVGAYIATMHPPVALALADWLDAAGADEWAHGPHCSTPCDDCDDDPRAPHIRSALALADAILGAER